MKLFRYEYYAIFTLLLFTIGLFNIIFAWLGFLCMMIPFIILFTTKKNKWCQSYCPRANLFTVLFKNTRNRPLPNWLKKKWVKEAVLTYFLLNMLVLTLSTTMVFLSRIEPIESIRLLMAFRLPWDLPQLINLPYIPTWAIHLSFRIYSMMLTTTIIGLILGLRYKPRTWCTICPVMTLSNKYLSNKKK